MPDPVVPEPPLEPPLEPPVEPPLDASLEPIIVVGIGADGWNGLDVSARSALASANVVVGAARQLELLPPEIVAERRAWPAPLLPALPALVAERAAKRLVVLASGDPLLFGIGGTLVRHFGADVVRVLPHVSSVSLACARLGWPVEEADVFSVVGRPTAALQAAFYPNRRVLVLLESSVQCTAIAAMLVGLGFGSSTLTMLAQLGAPGEASCRTTAADWSPQADHSLAILAIELRLDSGVVPIPRGPGLPDSTFEHDGQITKSEIRAVTLAALAPLPAQLLWDVGAGSGSVGIEWLRSYPDCRAISIEPRPDRAARVRRNADALGVPGIQIVTGKAPGALAGLAAPDAIFVGGAVSVPGVLEACVAALSPGGRLVANGVTLETESVLARWHAERGGSLVRIAVQRAEPVGDFRGWRPAMPVTQWTWRA
ncbi:precorrin-6y C5,15-methyltransferase (decarboxylating) subunit CbiE [Jatrophihabitans sp. DSM 45814]